MVTCSFVVADAGAECSAGSVKAVGVYEGMLSVRKGASPPLSLEKMTRDAKTGMVIYRSRMHKGLKRNF